MHNCTFRYRKYMYTTNQFLTKAGSKDSIHDCQDVRANPFEFLRGGGGLETSTIKYTFCQILAVRNAHQS